MTSASNGMNDVTSEDAVFNNNVIKYGDMIIIYCSRDSIHGIEVTPGQAFQSRFGHFKHDGMVGLPLGSKYSATSGHGFVYLLKFTPEWWTLALSHRTQILYQPDISFIMTMLDISPGSRVVEAGTGSGSFTHSLSRAVGPSGKVFSFEYHEDRFHKAVAEFSQHGLDNVDMTHRNVLTEGFLPMVDNADSVFLDLPAPWDVIAHAKQVMNRQRQTRICCFSPCIEQVIKTVDALVENGFYEISMYETLVRNQELTGGSYPTVSEMKSHLRQVEYKKEKRRLRQIENAKEQKRLKEQQQQGLDGTESTPEQGAPNEELAASQQGNRDKKPSGSEPILNADSEEQEISTKRQKLNSEGAEEKESTLEPQDTLEPIEVEKSPYPENTLLSKPGGYSRGHTSYLTFAILPPKIEVGSIKTLKK